MKNAIAIFIFLHIAFASYALFAMFVPLLSKKGGPLHKRMGRHFNFSIYIAGIAGLLVTSIELINNVPPTHFERVFSIFLSFMTINSIAAVLHGMNALKLKHKKERPLLHFPFFLLALNSIFSVYVAVLGISANSPAFFWFSLIVGAVNFKLSLYWVIRPKHPQHWRFAHIEGMLTTCAAVLTGFSTQSLYKLTDNTAWVNTVIYWIWPTLVVLTPFYIWTFIKKRKFKSSNPRGLCQK